MLRVPPHPPLHYSTSMSSLTMHNVPWHSDVRAFGEAVAKARGGEYELACEHEHSCCILLARPEKFKRYGKWHTWIDYDKFQELVSKRSGVIIGA